MHDMHIIFNSSLDPAERAVGGIFQAMIGGGLHLVDSRKASAQPQTGATRVHPEKFEELYCRVASTQGPHTVQVAPGCAGSVLRFMEQYPGTAGDFTSSVLSTTPVKDSQEGMIATLDKLLGLGLDCAGVRLLLVQAPRGVSPASAFSLTMEYLADSRYKALEPPAILYESVAFSQIRERQLPLAMMLNGEVNFLALLQAARERGDDEQVLHDLSQKLLTQRALQACRGDIQKTFAALRLSGDSPRQAVRSDSECQPLVDDRPQRLTFEAMPGSALTPATDIDTGAR